MHHLFPHETTSSVKLVFEESNATLPGFEWLLSASFFMRTVVDMEFVMRVNSLPLKEC